VINPVGDGKEVEDRIVTVLRKFGPMKRRPLCQKSRNKKVAIETWNTALRALKDACIIGIDPTGVHFLAETVEGM
jgi:hypothetical protein